MDVEKLRKERAWRLSVQQGAQVEQGKDEELEEQETWDEEYYGPEEYCPACYMEWVRVVAY